MFVSFVLGSDQLHLSYLGPKSRSVSWTSLAVDKPMNLTYKLKNSAAEPQTITSTVSKFIEPQDNSIVRKDYE